MTLRVRMTQISLRHNFVKNAAYVSFSDVILVQRHVCDVILASIGFGCCVKKKKKRKHYGKLKSRSTSQSVGSSVLCKIHIYLFLNCFVFILVSYPSRVWPLGWDVNSTYVLLALPASMGGTPRATEAPRGPVREENTSLWRVVSSRQDHEGPLLPEGFPPMLR